ncbi:hypothetical protein ElyMa_005221400 [Elysia marginata]|uniref:Uncharacterized protein n=1 Tax=Elysia marginata TaxID=1093978 RepID=A0AAV4JV27_9GAST|nr:hypothetical protein ElyMa_005221400 [Elysia marginata]
MAINVYKGQRGRKIGDSTKGRVGVSIQDRELFDDFTGTSIFTVTVIVCGREWCLEDPFITVIILAITSSFAFKLRSQWLDQYIHHSWDLRL